MDAAKRPQSSPYRRVGSPGGSSYQVRTVFQDASQIVSGDQVQIAGNTVGTVSKISLTRSGQAELTLSIENSSYTPLHQGTEATVRLSSLSGIANRYIDLRLGPANAPKIPSGGAITNTYTTSAVDIDQLFNTLKSGKLLSDIAVKQAYLTALVKNLGVTRQALASQKTALGQAIQQLPGFMALADTTFVNLRGSLDQLTPLVDASKPVAPKLVKFLAQLRPLAQNAVPTVRNLANLICSRGAKPGLFG
jgi:phospholipid/cholesterol/gamma-HCH transport system substrate-binding protein